MQAGAGQKVRSRKTYHSYSLNFWQLRAQIHVESPCHMLCAFCMRANHSSGFLAWPYIKAAFIFGACLFVHVLDAVDGLQTDYEHAGQAVIETSLSHMIGRP